MASNKKKVVTGEVRLSFPHLFETFAFDGQDEKYSVMLLIPKKDTATLKALRAAEAAAQEAGKDSKWGGKMPKDLLSIIHDADEDGTAEDYPERKGCYYMTVSAGVRFRPGVVDKDVQPILDESAVYSGMYGRVSLTAFPYSAGKNKGVSFGLNHVQILRDGEPLDGRTSAEDDFDAVESELI